MSEDIHALADAAQAVYFRGHLQQERADLTVELAHYTKTLTACRVAGDMRRVSGRVAGDMRRVSDLPHD